MDPALNPCAAVVVTVTVSVLALLAALDEREIEAIEAPVLDLLTLYLPCEGVVG